jgi:hypothetical protein
MGYAPFIMRITSRREDLPLAAITIVEMSKRAEMG